VKAFNFGRAATTNREPRAAADTGAGTKTVQRRYPPLRSTAKRNVRNSPNAHDLGGERDRFGEFGTPAGSRDIQPQRNRTATQADAAVSFRSRERLQRPRDFRFVKLRN
jgi:hypothetical protein